MRVVTAMIPGRGGRLAASASSLALQPTTPTKKEGPLSGQRGKRSWQQDLGESAEKEEEVDRRAQRLQRRREEREEEEKEEEELKEEGLSGARARRPQRRQEEKEEEEEEEEEEEPGEEDLIAEEREIRAREELEAGKDLSCFKGV